MINKIKFNLILNKKQKIFVILCVVIIALIGSYFLFYKSYESAEAGWWNEEWNYRQKLTIDAIKIDADLTDFPVAVILTTSNFTYANAQTNGEDIRFTDLSGNTLYHEIEKWNSSATSTIWVKIPQVDDTVDTIFYMYYGNGLTTDRQNKTAVWEDGFAAVYHLSETSGHHFDSTKNGNNTTVTNAETQGSYAGKIDGADFFNGTSNYLQVPHHISLDIVTSTISMWVRPETPVPIDKFYNVMIAREGAGRLSTIFINDTSNLCIYDGDYGYTCSNYQFATGTWTHVVVETTAPNNANLYINGQFNSSVSRGFINTPGSYLAMAARPGFPTNYHGALDEIRIYNIVRSAAWHKASYENGLNNLITLAAEEKGPGPVAYWAFDEGYGSTASDTANANDGTIYGATWKDETECVKGKCLYFDGTDDYVESIGNMGITGDSPRTVSMWFKQSSSSTKTIFAYGTNGETQLFEVELTGSATAIGHFYGLGNDTLTGAPIFRLNEWNHVAITYDGTKADVYLNGIYRNSKTISLNTGNSSVRIGRGIYLNNAYFNGYLDEVKVYDYARTADQIKVDYNRGLSLALGGNQYASLANGLVAYWQMDENSWNGTSGEVKDSSGNGNHGTSTGANTTSTAKFGKAGYFDGTDDNVLLSSSIDAGENSTISYWIKHNYQEIGSVPIGETSNEDSWVIWIQNTPYYKIGSTAVNWSVGDTSLGVYEHHTFVRKGTEVELFVNGVSKGKKSAAFSGSTKMNSIGAKPDGTYPTNGMIDEVRMYNRALSPDEVRRLSEWAPGPVSYYKFDEMSGATTYDTAASSTFSGGNHGTLGGGEGAARMPSWKDGSCSFGSCLKFDGDDDYVRLARDFDGDNLTITMWFNGDDTNGRQLAGHRSIAYSSLKRANATSISLRTSVDVIRTFTVPTMSPGIWYYLVVTRENGLFRIYLNGIESTTGGITDNGDFEIDSIGLYQGGQEFKGYIDDVRFYNYASNQRQILEDMHAGKKNNPVGYWNFDEGQGGTAYDRGFLATLGLGSNGTLTNMTTSGPSTAWSLNGRSGKALQFDGLDDVVTITNVSALDFNEGLASSASFSVWIKPNSDGENSVGQIFWKGDNTYLRLGNESGNKLDLGASIDLTTDAQATATASIIKNQWNHVVITWEDDADELTIYVNGEKKITSTNGSGSPPADTNNLLIGGTTSANFDGMIDEFKVYNYQLTLDEIRQNYNAGQQVVLSRSATDNQTEGLVGWWKMDEASWNGTASEVKDSSGNNNHGTAGGNANTTSTAKFGRAGEFNNNDYVNVGSSSSLNMGDGSITVSAWVNPTSLDTVDFIFFGGGGGGADGYGLSLDSSGNLRYEIKGTLGGRNNYTVALGLQTDIWYHLTTVFDGVNNRMRAYLNGNLVHSVDIPEPGSVDNAFDFYIGSHLGSTYYFDGMIDDVKVYNKVLSSEEIMREYADGPKPVAYWKLDEGDGLTAYDSIGGNNLTLGYSTYEEPSWEPIGKIGSGINLRGSVRNEAAAIADADLSVGFPGKDGGGKNYGMSAMTWVKLSSNKSKQDYLCKSSGSWCFWINNLKMTEYNAQITSDTTLPINQWFHMAFTYDGQEAKLYLNGILDKQKTYTGGINEHGNPFMIGGNEDYPDGMIDEAKIYNYARTQRQILEDMNAGQKSSPIGYWKFDEGQGNVANDYSGYGNHGTLVVGSGGTQSATSSAWTNGLTGKLNGSLNFDGTDDEVTIPGPELSIDGTIAGWFYWIGGTDSLFRDNTASNGWILAYNNGGILRYRVGGTEFITNISVSSLQNKWVHYLATKNGGSTNYYLDGNLVFTGTSAGNTTSTMPWHVMKNGTNASYTSGKADEIKIWNYPLTSAEVKNEYNGGFSSFFR